MTDSPGWPDGVLEMLSRLLIDDCSFGDTLLWIAKLACRASAADIAGITLLVDGGGHTGVFTQPAAREIDEAQYASGRGPSLDALRYQRVTRVDCTGRDTPWPDYCRIALAQGIVSSLSLPVVAQDETVGALNLYSSLPAAFAEDSVGGLEMVVALTAIVLTSALMYWDVRNLSENLNEAMATWETINFAIGILMAHSGRSPHEARQVLVRASQRENRSPRDVARGIVERVTRREVPGGSPSTA